MRKILLLPLLVLLCFGLKAQQVNKIGGTGTDNWMPGKGRVDSSWRLPLDTLASAPIYSEAYKSGTKYYKAADGHWHLVIASMTGVNVGVSGTAPVSVSGSTINISLIRDSTGKGVHHAITADGGTVFWGDSTPLYLVHPLQFTNDSTEQIDTAGGHFNAAWLQGIPISTTTPTSNQVLQYQTGCSCYVPATIAGGGGSPPYADNTALVENNADHTKLLILSAASIATGTTRTATFPNSNITVADQTTGLQQFASTSSAQLAGVLSDETGTGVAVFSTSPTFGGTAIFTNAPRLTTSSTINYVWTATDALGTGSWQVASSGFTNPMTNVGDLIIGNTGGAAIRLGIGANTYVLTSNGTTASWQPPSGGGTPGGSNTQLQFNNSGVFGASSNLTWSGTVLSTTGFNASSTVTLPGLTYSAGGAAFDVLLTDSTSSGKVWRTRYWPIDTTGYAAGNTVAYFTGTKFGLETVSGGGSTLTRQLINGSSGTNQTVTGGNYLVHIDFPATVASDTIMLAASPTDQQVNEFEGGGTLTSGKEITTLLVLPNSGQTIIGEFVLTSAGMGGIAKYRYYSTLSAWMRIY